MPALPRKHGIGSNAVALGKTATANGRGLLLGNPHYPWHGILRFYQMHLTIPAKMAVLGFSLPCLPPFAFVFTHDFACSHSFNTSVLFVLSFVFSVILFSFLFFLFFFLFFSFLFFFFFFFFFF